MPTEKKPMKIEPINSTFENNLLFYFIFFYYLLYLFRFYKNTKIQNTFINILHKKNMRLKEKKIQNYKFSKTNIEATPRSPQHPRRKSSCH